MNLPSITVLALIVLFPLVPAFVLFKQLNSTGRVNGTVYGFRIDLGGSAAGYIVLFFSLIYTRDTWFPEPYQVWDLNGQILSQDGDSILDEKGNRMDYVDPRYVTVSPPNLNNLKMDGKFSVKLVAVKQAKGSAYEFPDLVINYPGYKHKTIQLGPDATNDGKKNIFPMKNGTIDVGQLKLIRQPPSSQVALNNQNPYQ